MLLLLAYVTGGGRGGGGGAAGITSIVIVGFIMQLLECVVFCCLSGVCAVVAGAFSS